MIKIELDKAICSKIERLHKSYIETTALYKLEKMINLQDPKDEFLKRLFGDTKEERTRSIMSFCLSDNLENLIKIFQREFFTYYGFEYKQPQKIEERGIVEQIQTSLDIILDYKEFNKGKLVFENGEKKEWNRHLYVINTRVKVCPYCNRQYVTSYSEDDGDEKTTADVDHYYPKSIYPYLQMNIYNMIPSCSICNSRMKGSKDDRHLYPYKDSTDSLKFEISLDNVKDLYVGTVKKIEINTRNNPKAVSSNEVFKLEKVYQAHKENVSRLLWNMREYEAFKESYYKNTMGLDIGDIFPIWFDFLGKNALEEPLVKLKRDIYEQLLSSIENTQ